MTDEKIENGIRNLKNLKMTQEEKSFMLESILERNLEEKGGMPKKSLYFSFFNFSTRKVAFYSVLVLLVIIFGKSGIYFTGEKNPDRIAQTPNIASGTYGADKDNSREQKPSLENTNSNKQLPLPTQERRLSSDTGISAIGTENLNSAMLSAPAMSDNQKTEKYIDTANKLFENWLQEKGKEYPLLDYKINKILFIADKTTAQGNEAEWFDKEDTNDSFMVNINYSVRPTSENMFYWTAGNGKIGEDGWILNKSLFMKVDLKDSDYFIKSLETGP